MGLDKNNTVKYIVAMSAPSLTTRQDRLRTGSAKRREQNKLELKQQILEAATRLFTEHGYDGFSLRQVAEAIGYTPTTIYLYFKDKDELLYTVALEGFGKFGETLQAAYDQHRTAKERVRAIGMAYLRFGLSHPLHYRLMFMQRCEFLSAKPIEGYLSITDSFGVLLRALEEGIASGEFRPFEARALAGLLWTTVHGVVSLTLAAGTFTHAQAEGLFVWHMNVLEKEYTLV
jgi:AcrR family transcriptional regulator